MAVVMFMCILTVIRVPTVTSAPASLHSNVDYEERMNSVPKWINPCGFRASDFDNEMQRVLTLNDSQLERFPQINDTELNTAIYVAAKNALKQAQGFKDSYVSTPCRNRKCTFPSGTVLFPCVLGLMPPLRTSRN